MLAGMRPTQQFAVKFSQLDWRKLLFRENLKHDSQNVEIVDSFRKVLYFEIACYAASIYVFKTNNENTRTTYDICSKLTVNTPKLT